MQHKKFSLLKSFYLPQSMPFRTSFVLIPSNLLPHEAIRFNKSCCKHYPLCTWIKGTSLIEDVNIVLLMSITLNHGLQFYLLLQHLAKYQSKSILAFSKVLSNIWFKLHYSNILLQPENMEYINKIEEIIQTEWGTVSQGTLCWMYTEQEVGHVECTFCWPNKRKDHLNSWTLATWARPSPIKVSSFQNCYPFDCTLETLAM